VYVLNKQTSRGSRPAINQCVREAVAPCLRDGVLECCACVVCNECHNVVNAHCSRMPCTARAAAPAAAVLRQPPSMMSICTHVAAHGLSSGTACVPSALCAGTHAQQRPRRSPCPHRQRPETTAADAAATAAARRCCVSGIDAANPDDEDRQRRGMQRAGYWARHKTEYHRRATTSGSDTYAMPAGHYSFCTRRRAHRRKRGWSELNRQRHRRCAPAICESTFMTVRRCRTNNATCATLISGRNYPPGIVRQRRLCCAHIDARGYAAAPGCSRHALRVR
jgi:hypothetical protein